MGAVETRKPRPLLVDPTAAHIIATNVSFVSQLSWIARSLHTDRTISEFLNEHPSATIVNLGCGLDTTFERVDNGKLSRVRSWMKRGWTPWTARRQRCLSPVECSITSNQKKSKLCCADSPTGCPAANFALMLVFSARARGR